MVICVLIFAVLFLRLEDENMTIISAGEYLPFVVDVYYVKSSPFRIGIE